MKLVKILLALFFLSVTVQFGYAQKGSKKQKQAEENQARLDVQALKAQKKAIKKHRKGQDKGTRKRMKKNEKKSNRIARPKRWSAKKKKVKRN